MERIIGVCSKITFLELFCLSGKASDSCRRHQLGLVSGVVFFFSGSELRTARFGVVFGVSSENIIVLKGS